VAKLNLTFIGAVVECALYYRADSEQIAPFYFGMAKLNLKFIGVIVARDRCQFGSWMIFVALYLSFCEAGKGL
jgi:hypothetical protein